MSLEEIKNTKIKKVEKLRKAGIDPYPAVLKFTDRIKISETLKNYGSWKVSEESAGEDKYHALAGRVMAKREHGGSTFFDLDDGSGRIQGYIKEDVVGVEKYELLDEFVDVGDFIEVRGFLKDTKKQEKTIYIADFNILSKTLLPLPEKWHGLQDAEERFRKRYLDLIFNEEVKNKILTRFKIFDLLRVFFRDNGFIEVETPVLQPIPGGAAARPFKTHMNDLNMDLYLRVAPELYLKRFLVGGFERVFEVAKNFRNEGMDREHNPEFDMLEAYAAYQDYEWLMNLTEDLMIFICRELYGKDEIEYAGRKIKFQKPFARMEFDEIIKKYSGLDYDKASREEIARKAKELKIDLDKTLAKENIADEIFKKLARPEMISPVFVINHPIELSPLSKKHRARPGKVERFQLVIGGLELTNAFSELNDPADQRERLEAQEEIRRKGNEEAYRLDEDFIEALEYGMPSAAGIGIGIDRLVALFTNARTLREILPFPLMKEK